MPMDPFFTSAHKKHFIASPKFAALMAEIRALPPDEQRAWVDRMWRTPKEERSRAEASVMKALTFEFQRAASVRRRIGAEALFDKLNVAATHTHTHVGLGFSTEGGHGGHQNRALKVATHPNYPERSKRRVLKRT